MYRYRKGCCRHNRKLNVCRLLQEAGPARSLKVSEAESARFSEERREEIGVFDRVEREGAPRERTGENEMHKEFEGRTEQEAIDKAVEELGLDRDDFDVEILEKEKKGLFRKGNDVILPQGTNINVLLLQPIDLPLH